MEYVEPFSVSPEAFRGILWLRYLGGNWAADEIQIRKLVWLDVWLDVRLDLVCKWLISIHIYHNNN